MELEGMFEGINGETFEYTLTPDMGKYDYKVDFKNSSVKNQHWVGFVTITEEHEDEADEIIKKMADHYIENCPPEPEEEPEDKEIFEVADHYRDLNY